MSQRRISNAEKKAPKKVSYGAPSSSSINQSPARSRRNMYEGVRPPTPRVVPRIVRFEPPSAINSPASRRRLSSTDSTPPRRNMYESTRPPTPKYVSRHYENFKEENEGPISSRTRSRLRARSQSPASSSSARSSRQSSDSSSGSLRHGRRNQSLPAESRRRPGVLPKDPKKSREEEESQRMLVKILESPDFKKAVSKAGYILQPKKLNFDLDDDEEAEKPQPVEDNQSSDDEEAAPSTPRGRRR